MHVDVVPCVKQVAYLRCNKRLRKSVTTIVVRSAGVSRDVSSVERKKRLAGPIQFLNRLLETWNLDSIEATQLLGLQQSESTYVSDLLDGTVTLYRDDVKERIVYLFRIRKTLSALFQDVEVENSWLREAHQTLNKKIPMQLLLDGSDLSLMLVLEYVEAAAGR